MPLSAAEPSLENIATSRGKKRRVATICVVALLFRLALIFVFHTYRWVETANHHGFAFETGSIAGALASGQGFSNPFGEPTGPTAWIAPIYPAILAGAFLVFGLYSKGAAIAMLIFNSICAALTVPVIYRIGRRVFGASAAEAAAWIWALVPFFARWPVGWIWETSLSALLCSIAFLITLEIGTEEWRPWAGLGILWGVIALASPAVMSFLPASLLYPAVKRRRWNFASVRNMAIATAFLAVSIAPWMARNAHVFHRRAFLRTNFWVEVSLSNYHLSTGEAYSGRHPANNARILRDYRERGEVDFAAERKQQVLQFVKQYPGEFLKLISIRIVHFWDGGELMYESPRDPFKPWMVLLTSLLAFGGLWLAASKGYDWSLFGWLFLLFPLPYYFAYTYPRYRHPIEPMMTVLTGFLVTEAWKWCRRKNSVKQRDVG